MKESKLTFLRDALLAGIVLLLPVAVTWMIFSWLVETIGGSVRPLVFPESLQSHPSLQFAWDVVAMLIVLVLVTCLGILSRYVLGRFFASLADRIIQSIPGLNAIYNMVKQVVDTFGPQKKDMFSKVVLLEYPRKGCWSIGFVTNTTRGLPQSKLPMETWTVFVPTTPNPTGGFLLLLPREELIELEMSVGDGMKMVISGGAIIPPEPASTTPPKA